MPPEGPVIVAANHASYLDPPLVSGLFRRPIGFMARYSLFRFKPFGWYISALNAFPVSQENPMSAIKACGERLKNGEAVLIFPEGTRTLDGKLGPIKDGASMLANKHKAAILPVYIRGTFNSWPKGKCFPRWARIRAWIGDPIQPVDAEGKAIPTRELTRMLSEVLHAMEAAATH